MTCVLDTATMTLYCAVMGTTNVWADLADTLDDYYSLVVKPRDLQPKNDLKPIPNMPWHVKTPEQFCSGYFMQ